MFCTETIGGCNSEPMSLIKCEGLNSSTVLYLPYLSFTANPTNFGLHEQLQNKWKSQIADETHGEFESTYASSFVGHGADAMPNVRLVFFFKFFFLAFYFLSVVIVFVHPRHNGQWPLISKEFISQILSITFIFLS